MKTDRQLADRAEIGHRTALTIFFDFIFLYLSQTQQYCTHHLVEMQQLQMTLAYP